MNDRIKEARDFAIKWHGEQKYGEWSYIYHLDQVAELVRIKGYGETVIISAYLHDIIEDTNCKFNYIKDKFGEIVEELVYFLTDEVGRDREERKNKTYEKLRESHTSTIIKVADRICNIKFSSENDKRKTLMYLEESSEFERNLRPNTHYDDIWKDYDNAILEARKSFFLT